MHLPFSDPEKDKDFMRAAKEERVVTVKQDPTSKQKDFGIVGFLKEKFATYLVFSRSLGEYSGQRVVGIKYDLLKSVDVADQVIFPGRKLPNQRSKSLNRSQNASRFACASLPSRKKRAKSLRGHSPKLKQRPLRK